MQVILKENIETLGHIGDIVKVAPGYARNYLLPKGLAVEATAKNAKELEHVKRQMAYRKDKALESARNLAAKLAETPIALLHKAGDEGKLFGSVGTGDIAHAVTAAGQPVERHEVRLPEGPFRALGEYDVALHLHTDVNATIKLIIVAE